MRYTLKQFQAEYPNNDVCLEAVFQDRFGDLKFCPSCSAETKFYRVKGRQCYACKWCGHQIFPLAKTIFRRTTTPLTDWFYAIYLFSTHKNGVSAPTLQAELGVTYKTAWRMCRLIRLLMSEDVHLGKDNPVEIDELEYGHQGKAKNTRAFMAVERGGKAKFQVTDWVSTNRAMTFIRAYMETDIELYSDGSRVYYWADKEYKHSAVNHSKKQWAKGKAHINTIEGLWGYIEACITGTYRGVSPKYLQNYLNEYVYRYNHKDEIICRSLLVKAARLS